MFWIEQIIALKNPSFSPFPSPRSLTDRIRPCGGWDRGSIPRGGVIILRKTATN